MSSRSRGLSTLTLLLVSSVLIVGPIGCASPKPRDKWWQFWRRKKADAPAIFHPDSFTVPAPEGAPPLAGVDEFGNSYPLLAEGELVPPEPLEELAYLPEPEPLRQEASMQVAELQPIFFPFDSAELSPDAQRVLEQNVEWLRANPGVQVQIEGHTDERGTIEYNLLLGERRAKSVKAYLLARGIPDSVLHTISYGEERPLDPNPDEQAYSKNRRAQFLVY